jgi:hypothetical protein
MMGKKTKEREVNDLMAALITTYDPFGLSKEFSGLEFLSSGVYRGPANTAQILHGFDILLTLVTVSFSWP